MTGRYAQLADTTIRRHWEAARKVNINGQTVTLDPDGPLAEAAWASQRIGHATQALPNGYCGLPAVKACPHANDLFSEAKPALTSENPKLSAERPGQRLQRTGGPSGGQTRRRGRRGPRRTARPAHCGFRAYLGRTPASVHAQPLREDAARSTIAFPLLSDVEKSSGWPSVGGRIGYSLLNWAVAAQHACVPRRRVTRMPVCPIGVYERSGTHPYQQARAAWSAHSLLFRAA
jgi:hypothetical protein